MNLFPFQQTAVDFFDIQRSVLCADEMGTGKSYIGTARDLRIRSKFKGKTLVVATMSTLDMWRRMFEAEGLKVRVINPKKRELLFNHPADVYVVHWAALQQRGGHWLTPDLMEVQFMHVIADEVHHAQNRNAQQTIGLKRIKTVFKTGLSGTPVTNTPDKLWSILNWLYPQEFSSYWRFYGKFVDFEIDPAGGYRKIKGPKNVPLLHEKIRSYYLRRLKEEVLPELPDKYYCTPLETPIMMADLSFKSIGEVAVGDTIMGWADSIGPGSRRTLKSTEVISIGRLIAPVFIVTMESGRELRCTADHKWLNGTLNSTKWTNAKVGKNLVYVTDIPKELTRNQQDAALWLGGIMDGEGCFKSDRVTNNYQWGIYQSQTVNPGVHRKIKETLDQLGISYIQDRDGNNFRISVNRSNAVKILTWCKPVKDTALLHTVMFRGLTRDKIINVEPIGEQEVAWLETGTGNYIAWGYASKNSEIVVDLTEKQQKAYDEMRTHMITWLEDQPLVAPVVVAQLQRLQQFACAYAKITPQGVVLTEPSSKLDALMELIEMGNQIVVFSQFRQMTDLLTVRLKKKGIEYSKITGKVPQFMRQREVDRFQRGDSQVFMGTIAAGGEGITLTSASCVAFLDRDWSPANNSQAEDRLHRMGQQNAVQVVDFIARGTVDLGRRTKLEVKREWLRQLLDPS